VQLSLRRDDEVDSARSAASSPRAALSSSPSRATMAPLDLTSDKLDSYKQQALDEFSKQARSPLALTPTSPSLVLAR